MDFKKITALGCLFFILSSCTCGVPLRVTSIQRSDKKLACKDIILEINEAEHYRDAAAREQAIGIGEALMPLCWVSGFVDGEVAVKKANARIDYLGHIYDLMDCSGKGKKKSLPQTPAKQPIVVKVPKPAPQPKAPEPIKIPDPKPSHYRQMKNLGPNTMHEHMDRDGKLYIHSHKHSGPHRHLEDQ